MSQQYPWLQKYRDLLLPQRQRWSHAWLLSGPEGIGKYALARWMTCVLLCESPLHDSSPCGTCTACTWSATYKHPDDHLCLPENVTSFDFSFLSYSDNDWIKLDAIRALQTRIYLPPHRQQAKVALIYPADLMNTAASNALLKLLEEPPPQTTFLLVAHRLHRILPTLRSRCHQLMITEPALETSRAWCTEHDIPETLLAEAGRCPLKAAALKHTHELLGSLIKQLFNPGSLDIDKWKTWIDKLPKTERRAALNHAIDSVHKAVHDWLSLYHNHPARFFPAQQPAFSQHLERLSIHKLLNLDHALNSVRRHSKHPLNPTWILEDIMLRYAALWS